MRGIEIISMIAAAIVLLVISAPLLANGDSPRAVYDLYIVAQRAGDVDGMAAFVTKAKVEQLKAMPAEQKVQIGEMMKMMAPTEYTVITEDVQGDTTTLTIKGRATDFSGVVNEQEGTARFVKEDGAWKLAKEIWKVISAQ